ncbi:hypothetical protein H6P81_005118 [Aristolochia fimbriata]|uniref:phosphatidylglycerophosphatase n=1 Tax=Aristolochia fimbriata TaxID=158543 RepID=A0AAV7EUZ0_ARIFI|nr:hypothetical protein H6P81_005118 [Aristolochia fimbriata]
MNSHSHTAAYGRASATLAWFAWTHIIATTERSRSHAIRTRGPSRCVPPSSSKWIYFVERDRKVVGVERAIAFGFRMRIGGNGGQGILGFCCGYGFRLDRGVTGFDFQLLGNKFGSSEDRIGGMHIEELKEGESGCVDEESASKVCQHEIVLFDAKRVLIGAGARLLFYPTLLYNVVRNKIHAEFRWWDEVDQFLLLGAVPFPGDVPRLKLLGVHGVVTLNEPYETLVPTSLYHAHGIDHLVIPTRDYLFAPSFGDICRAVDFIHKIASRGNRTYVHCKAGRGRSTTVVLCYLVRHRQMTPQAAFDHVRSRRPRVLLAASQWQAVQEFYQHGLKKVDGSYCVANPVPRTHGALISAAQKFVGFDESSSVVVVTESDLDGYDGTHESGIVGNDIWAEWGLVYRVQFAGQAALTRISCLWIRCHARSKITMEEAGGKKSCSAEADQLGGMGVDIPVY